jgi:hypothetical protein
MKGQNNGFVSGTRYLDFGNGALAGLALLARPQNYAKYLKKALTRSEISC